MEPAPPRGLRTAVLSAAAVLILVAPPASGQPADARHRPFPYAVGWGSAGLLPSAVGLSLLADLVAPDPQPLTRAELAPLSPGDINAFDRVAARSWSEGWGTLSDRSRDALLGAALLVSFAPSVREGRWRDAATLGVMFAQAALLVEGATYLAKDLAGRKRPWVYNTSLSVEKRLALSAADPLDARRSFFSGHTAAAFTLATLLSTVYADVHGRSRTSNALWAASLSAAALTAFARVKAGMHYPSDVLAGAAAGVAVGRAVPLVHRANRRPETQISAGPMGIAVKVPLGGGPGR